MCPGKWLCVFEECSFAAVQSSRVKKHVRTVHMKQGNWKCEICEKDGKPTQKFTNLTNLNHHITGVHYGYSTKHKNTGTFVCDLCGATIAGKAKMEQHKLRVHRYSLIIKTST